MSRARHEKGAQAWGSGNRDSLEHPDSHATHILFTEHPNRKVMTTGYVYDEGHKAHTHAVAPDCARRLEHVVNYLKEKGALEPLKHLPVEPIPWEWIARAHTGSHIESVRSRAAAGGQRISFDTYLTPAAPEVGRLGASSAVAATRAVLEGTVTNAFSLMRPPGHHAKPAQAMGYGLFNNIAVAAWYALREHDLERVMIVDIDAHHGNGTEEIFYHTDEVLFVSLHQHPWFPGTGDWFRQGTEAGLGYNYNVPMPQWSGDASYTQALRELVVPLAERYRPQLLMVSAGFDAHWMDHSSVLGLSVQGYYDLVSGLREVAAEHCAGRLVFNLEGGYHLAALGACTWAALRALSGASPPQDTLGPCPDKPVAPIGDVLVRLRGMMDLMRKPGQKGFYEQSAVIPYPLK